MFQSLKPTDLTSLSKIIWPWSNKIAHFDKHHRSVYLIFCDLKRYCRNVLISNSQQGALQGLPDVALIIARFAFLLFTSSWNQSKNQKNERSWFFLIISFFYSSSWHPARTGNRITIIWWKNSTNFCQLLNDVCWNRM